MNSYALINQHDIKADITNELIQKLVKNHTLGFLDDAEFVSQVKDYTRKNKIDALVNE